MSKFRNSLAMSYCTTVLDFAPLMYASSSSYGCG